MRPALALALFVLSAPTVLSEADRTAAELHTTKVLLLQTQEQVASCQIKLQAAVLAEEQLKLERTFRDVLKPAPDEIFDWTTLSFEKPK